jgi:hypothetical protein
MTTQRISAVLLRGLLARYSAKAAWSSVYVRSSVFGGDYRARLPMKSTRPLP